MKRNRCEGCKALCAEPLECRLGHGITSETYSNGRVDYYSLEVCPKPTTYRHMKSLLEERKIK